MTGACILCGASSKDKAGDLRHEPCCPHFMRGPDAGGDPAEWPTLFGDHDAPLTLDVLAR